MAEDTRDEVDTETTTLQAQLDARRAANKPKPKHEFPKTQASKMWDALHDPSNPVNEMPGGTYNSAGGKGKEVTWRDAFNVDLLDPKMPAFYQTGCGRDSLLVGIGTGGAIGGLSFILRGISSMLFSTNLAVGAFATTSCGLYYWCSQRKAEEAKGMALAVRGMKMLNEKRAKEKAEKAAAEEAARKAEEERKARSWSNKLKFW